MNYTITEVRNRLMSKKYVMGRHTMRRIMEDDISDVSAIISHLGTTGDVERGFNQGGVCWTFEGDFAGQPYRLIVGLCKTNPDWMFLISLFKVLPGIVKGQNHGKYAGRMPTYTIDFPSAA